MNAPVLSKITDKHEKHVFPYGTEQTQKMMNFEVPNVHAQGGVIRNPNVHLPGYNYVADCPKVFLTDQGPSDGKTVFATIAQANAAYAASMPFARTLFFIGCALVLLAVAVGALNYFRPVTFGAYSRNVPMVFVFLFVLGLAFIIYDRRDSF